MNVGPLLQDWVPGSFHELLYSARIRLYLVPLPSSDRWERWGTKTQELPGFLSRYKAELGFSSGSGCLNIRPINIMLLLMLGKHMPKNPQTVNAQTWHPASGVWLYILSTPVCSLGPSVFPFVCTHLSATRELDTRQRKMMWGLLARRTRRRWWRGRSHWRCALLWEDVSALGLANPLSWFTVDKQPL